MGPNYNARPGAAGTSLEGDMGLQGSAAFAYKEGYRRCIQTDGSWSSMVSRTATPHHAGVYSGVWQHRQDPHRQPAAAFVLSQWDCRMELFPGNIPADLRRVP